ncbi:MAG TPA: glycosyltransferase, partial [Candidatus Saccharimonadales bacterium]|nr:glycosyltransferase [Candidatus Saccharimonadales bacterium]
MKKVKSAQKNTALDILVPVKNEEKNVEELTKQINNALEPKNINYTLIFIVDKSTDNTLGVLQKLATKYPIKIYEKKGKTGKAYSILEGMDYTTNEFVAFIDGDLQYSPKYLPQMFEVISRDPKIGVVVGNRVVYKSSFIRRAGSRLNALIFGKFLLGLNCDIQSGLKVFRRDAIKHIDKSLVSPWTIDIPLLNAATQLGYNIASVDIEFENRRAGQSKVGFVRTAFEIAKCAIKTKLKGKQLYEMPDGFVYNKKYYQTHTNLAHKNTALYVLVNHQKITIILGLIVLIGGLIINPLATMVSLIAILSAIYFLDVLFNLYVVLKSLHFPPEIDVSSEKLAQLNDADLPVYTIMCPLYKEAAVLPDFVKNVSQIDWPKDKLEVLLLLEIDDEVTRTLAEKMNLPEYIKIVTVPLSQPKTKPKACNYGLKVAKGDFVVVYDAEDRPAFDQLKKAYIAFKEGNEKLFCVQAKLNYFNPHHNLLTRLFTAEYSLWFDVMLPGLQSINTTIPLGGTSNHFRTADLKSLSGWDPFNVTEDCDLGVRIFKEGYNTIIIDSVTLEE